MGLFAQLARKVCGRKGPEDVLRILRDERAKAWALATPVREGDVGYDLVCVEDTIVPPGLLPPTALPTGIRVKLPKGAFAIIIARSSSYHRFPTLVLCSAPIDNGYVGSLNPRVRNLGTESVLVPAGTAVAQLVLFNSVVPAVLEVNDLPQTERGEAAYGSTGK